MTFAKAGLEPTLQYVMPHTAHWLSECRQLRNVVRLCVGHFNAFILHIDIFNTLYGYAYKVLKYSIIFIHLECGIMSYITVRCWLSFCAMEDSWIAVICVGLLVEFLVLNDVDVM